MTLKADKLFDCVVLGGGPAGLSMAYQLSRNADIDYTILERADLGHQSVTDQID